MALTGPSAPPVNGKREIRHPKAGIRHEDFVVTSLPVQLCMVKPTAMKKITFLLAALLLLSLVSCGHKNTVADSKAGTPVLVGNPIFVLNQ